MSPFMIMLEKLFALFQEIFQRAFQVHRKASTRAALIFQSRTPNPFSAGDDDECLSLTLMNFYQFFTAV